MDPAKKRSASQANLAFANRPTKRRQAPRQPSSQPFSLNLLSLPSQSRVLDLAGSALAYMSKGKGHPSHGHCKKRRTLTFITSLSALTAETTPINVGDAVDVDVPGSFPVRNPSTLANGGTHIEKREEIEAEVEEEDDQDESITSQREMSEVLTQTHGSSDGSPVPDTPLQSKAGSSSPVRDISTYEPTFASERSTPLSTSPRKGAIRKPVLKLGFRHHAHPLKKQVCVHIYRISKEAFACQLTPLPFLNWPQHELEQRLKHTKELFLMKRARGYSQDLSTFRGEL
jgi:hypothetical protein